MIRKGIPVKIKGVTYVPKWDWSDWYYQHVKEMLQKQGSDRSPIDRVRSINMKQDMKT